MLQVRDVAASSRWYQNSLGLVSGHGGDEFEMLFHGDRFLLQLHHLDAHEHGILLSDPDAPIGRGVSLWFESPDRAGFEALFARANRAGAEVVEPPHWNALAHHHEATLVDPDGYIVVINSPFEFEASVAD